VQSQYNASLESRVPAEARSADDRRRDDHGRSHDCWCGRSRNYRCGGSHDYGCWGDNNCAVCPAASIRTAVKSNSAASFGLSTEPKSGSWRPAAVWQIADIMRYGQETRGFAAATGG
jgi:hypothetical protein